MFLIPSIIQGIGSIFSGFGAARAQENKNRAKQRQAARLGDVAQMIQGASGVGAPVFGGAAARHYGMMDVNPVQAGQINPNQFDIEAPEMEGFGELSDQFQNADLSAAANRVLSRASRSMDSSLAGAGIRKSGSGLGLQRGLRADVFTDLAQQISQNDLARLGMNLQHEQFGAGQQLQSRMANQSVGSNLAMSNREARLRAAMANQGTAMQQSQMLQQNRQWNQNHQLNKGAAMAQIYGHEGFAVPENDPLGTALGAIGGGLGAGATAWAGMTPFMPQVQPTTGPRRETATDPSRHGGWYAG